jgi:transposase-like protein
VKLLPDPAPSKAWDQLLRTSNQACNWWSERAWEGKALRQYALHKLAVLGGPQADERGLQADHTMCGVACSGTGQNWSSASGGISSPTNKSWRVDETYLRVQGRWCYLYRAIDSAGASIDFLLSALRDADAAKRLFRKALSDQSHPQPRVINTDLAPIYGAAIADIKKKGILRRRCRHRPVQYLNNILEQDHRAIKSSERQARISRVPGGKANDSRI